MTGILALGYRIADEIGANDNHNTTGKWIAHYLAEKLEEAKSEPSKNEECLKLILELWQTRRNWPSGDPFSKYDFLLPKLSVLLRGEGRFFGGQLDDSQADAEADRQANAALKVDELSSGLVLELLKDSVEKSGIVEDEWLADAAESADDPQTKFLLKLGRWAKESPPNVGQKLKDLRNYLEELERDGADGQEN